MGGSKNKKAIADFIDEVLEYKLEGLPETAGSIHKDRDFHLDMQGVSLLLGHKLILDADESTDDQ